MDGDAETNKPLNFEQYDQIRDQVVPNEPKTADVEEFAHKYIGKSTEQQTAEADITTITETPDQKKKRKMKEEYGSTPASRNNMPILSNEVRAVNRKGGTDYSDTFLYPANKVEPRRKVKSKKTNEASTTTVIQNQSSITMPEPVTKEQIEDATAKMKELKERLGMGKIRKINKDALRKLLRSRSQAIRPALIGLVQSDTIA